MRSAPLLFAGICLALAAPAEAQRAPRDARAQLQTHERYFVDFRARGGGLLGHTFIVYGRVDAQGRVIEQRHAGLYPDDAYAASPLLPVAVVPGYVSFKREDPSKPQVAVYRRMLSGNEYAQLRSTLQRLQASRPRWHMVFYNCNDFAAQVARDLGMWAPMSWSLPGNFVEHLQAMNGR